MGHVPLLFTTMLWVVIILLLLLLFRLLDVNCWWSSVGLRFRPVWKCDTYHCDIPATTDIFISSSLCLPVFLFVCLSPSPPLSRCLSVSLPPHTPLFLSLFLRPSLSQSLLGGGLGVNSCGAKTCMKWNTSRLWRNIPLHYLPFPSWRCFAFKII